MAHKRNLPEPAKWILRPDKVPVFHKIEFMEEVMVIGKRKPALVPARYPMQLVKLWSRCDLNDPSVDLAAMVGYLDTNYPQKPELWYWREKFWAKAVEFGGIEYYKDKCYLLYPITIADEDGLHNSLKI
jgi:hypothetical protein